MIALLCCYLTLLVSPFKSKSRLEVRERGAPTSADTGASLPNDLFLGCVRSRNLLLKREEAVLLQMVSQLVSELPLFLMTAVATHLAMSFAQTLMHYKLGHHPMGGKFFRNHINFHHTYYSKDHLVSQTYLGDEGDEVGRS